MSNTPSNITSASTATATASSNSVSNRLSPSRSRDRHRLYNASGKFSGKSVLEAKRLSQLALQRHAISQLKKVARPTPSPNRGTIAYTLGKDLFLVLRYIPLGILNKVQSSISSQFNLTTTTPATAAATGIMNATRHSSTDSNSNSTGSHDSNNNNNPIDINIDIGKTQGENVANSSRLESSQTEIIENSKPLNTTLVDEQNNLQCQSQSQDLENSEKTVTATASIFNKASLLTLMMKEKVYMLKNANLNLINNLSNNPNSPEDTNNNSVSSRLSRFASSVSSAKTKLITINQKEGSDLPSNTNTSTNSSSGSSSGMERIVDNEAASGSISVTTASDSGSLSTCTTDWGLDPDLKPFMQEGLNSEWKFVEARTRFLVSKIISVVDDDDTRGEKIQHVEDLYQHLLQYRESRGTAIECGAIKSLVRILKAHPDDTCLLNSTRETLAILGCNPPLKGHGIKILSIDGGGVRGLVAIEVLRMMEKQTGQRVHEMFDYICGVSTGSILAFLLGAHRRTLDECEALYMQLSQEIFTQNSFIGAGSLLWSHSYYDTAAWEKILKRHIGNSPLMTQARYPDLPRVAAISTLVNQERVSPYVFRTYAFAPHVRSHYTGGCRHEMWEAIRASAAAPSYFEEVKLGPNLHQDGGVLVNNPASVALSEAKTIWPGQPLQCVMSLGTGQTFSSRKNPNMSDLSSHSPHHGEHGHGHGHGQQSHKIRQQKEAAKCSSLSWKGKFLKVLDSATDTESVHYTLQELLPPHVYFRFNPYLSEMITMDESKPEKLSQLQRETREYLVRNMDKVEYCCQNMTKPKGMTKRLYDWWNFHG